MDRERARKAFRQQRGYEPSPDWAGTDQDVADAGLTIEDQPPSPIMGDDEDKSGLLSFLDTMDAPFQVVGNVLRGNLGAAGRKAVDALGDIVDAPLPGNWIPHISHPDDEVSGHQLLGMDENDPAVMRLAADVGIGTALNPLSWISFGAGKGLQVAGKTILGAGKTLDPLTLAGKGIGKLVDKLPEKIGQPLTELGQTARAAFGKQRVNKDVEPILADARTAGTREAAAGLGAGKAALQGFDERQLQIIGDAMDNHRWEKGQLTGELVPTSTDPVMGVRSGSLRDRIAAHPDVKPGEVDALAKAAEAVAQIGRNQKVRKGVFTKDAQKNLSDEYLARGYEGRPENATIEDALGTAAPLKERSLEGWREVKQYLKDNPNVVYERNALKRMASRAQTHGEISKRADLGAGILDLVRQGKLELPKEVIEKAAGKLEDFKAPVPETGAYEDVGSMMGGDAVERQRLMDELVGPQSGRAMPPETPEIADSAPDAYGIGAQSGVAKPPLTPAMPEAPPDPYGIGSFSGTSKPPVSVPAMITKQMERELRGLKYGEDQIRQMTPAEANDILESGRMAESVAAVPDANDVYGLHSFSGKAKPPTTPEIAAEAADPYAVGSFSGKAKPPETPKIEPTPADPYGVGAQTGQAAPPRTGPIEEGNRSLESYGLGEQSGKAVVGERTAQTGKTFTPEQLQKAKDHLLSKEYALADPESKSLVTAVIDHLAAKDPETAKVLTEAFGGMAPRGKFMSWLATANRAFKPYAVYGFAIPKFGAIVRNKISGVWQALSNPESRGVAGGQAKRVISDLQGAVVDSLGLKTGRDQFSGMLDAWEKSLAASGGSGDQAISIMAKSHPKVAELIKAGVIDGFVRSEDLIKEMSRTGWKKQFANVSEWPARMFKGVEDRMRLGMGMDLMAKGKSAEDAARIVRDSLYDYSVSSIENRRARDLIPFFQYTANAIPQQAKLMARHPVMATALAQVMGDDPNHPVYPWMEGKLNIPVGGNEYISGLGLPFETLGQIPNPSGSVAGLGRDVERDVVAAGHPLLKTAFSAVSGEDPYFETPYGSYSKMPIVGEAGEVGRLYNQAAGTGMIQPLDSPLRFIDKLIDQRRSAPVKALDTLTGANVVDVDPQRAVEQQLTQQLTRNPTVQQYRGLFQTSKDPQTQAALKALSDLKAKMKHDRQAELKKGDIN